MSPRIIALLFLAAVLPAQNRAFDPGGMDTILYGVAYYPEYMPHDRLEKDVDLMQKAGITVVRVGESTWSSWEPRDGQFEFAWMQRVLDRMHQAGIKVILGTPTYSIPTWLYKAHPEIAVTHNGTAPPLSSPYSPSYPPSLEPGYYGPRQNYDFLNPRFPPLRRENHPPGGRPLQGPSRRHRLSGRQRNLPHRRRDPFHYRGLPRSPQT